MYGGGNGVCVRVAYVKAREVRDDGAEPLADRLLRELDLPHVERPDAADLVPGVNHCRGFALWGRGDGGDMGEGDKRWSNSNRPVRSTYNSETGQKTEAELWGDSSSW